MNKHKNSMKRLFLTPVLLGALLSGLSGCDTFHNSTVAIKNATTDTDSNLAILNGYQGTSVDTVHDTPFLAGTEISAAQTQDGAGDPLFSKTAILDTSKPLTLDQVASLITQQTGVPVNISSQVEGLLSSSSQNHQQTTLLPSLPGQTGVVSAPQIAGQSPSQNQLNIDYDGPLRGLLNLVASRSGTFWKFADGNIEFYLTDTKVYQINALPGVATMSASISNAGNTGTSSGASGGTNSSTTNGSTSQTAGLTASLDLYTSIEDSVNTILAETQSAGGSGTNLNVPTSVAVNQAAGEIIVTATPPELQSVDNLLTPLNQELAKNVMIDLHIYSVQLSDDNNYGLNLAAAFQDVASRYGLSFSSVQAPSLSTGGGTLSAAILSAPATGQGGLTTTTSGVVQALATQGNVSLVTDGSVLALNGQPTPLQVAQNKAYLASSSTTETSNVGSSTTLTPGSYVVGFQGTFLPLIRGDQILLEYNVNLTQDLGLQTLTASNTEIQLPQTAVQSFMQRVALRSGETLVLSGFDQDSDQTNNTGTGSANFFLLGGGRSVTHSKQALVVVIHVENLGT